MGHGSSAGVMRFFSRTSAGSRPRSEAIRSSRRSRKKLASNRPGPRYVPVGVLLVSTACTSHAKCGMRYGPGRNCAALAGTTPPFVRTYAPMSASRRPRKPRIVPSARAAISSSHSIWREWFVAMKLSRRPSIHFTGRPSLMAASGISRSSG